MPQSNRHSRHCEQSAEYKCEIKLEILSRLRSRDNETLNKMTSQITTERSYVKFEIAGNSTKKIRSVKTLSHILEYIAYLLQIHSEVLNVRT